MDKEQLRLGIMIVCLCFVFFLIGVAFSYRAGFNYAQENYECNIYSASESQIKYYKEHGELPTTPKGVQEWQNWTLPNS